MKRDGQSPDGGNLPGPEHARPVQGQGDIAQVDIKNHVLPVKTGGRRLLIEVQHRVHPALEGGEDVAGAPAHPQQQQGLQRPVPGHDEPQVRILSPHHSPDEVLRQGQHGGDLPPLQGGQGRLLVHGDNFAILGDILHAPHELFQLLGDAVPLRGGNGQGDSLKVHPPGQQNLRRPARPKGEQEA